MENNELQSAPAQDYQFAFKGEGSAYFGILIVNWILTVLTFGFYYPWARAKQLQYTYSNTTLNNESFHFSGTGAEIFKGFLKLILFYALMLVGIFSLTALTKEPLLVLIFIYLFIFALLPIIVHGSLRYRMSRTSYRGIRFGYRGSRSELTKQFYKDIFLTIVSIGIYSSWLQMNLRVYTHKHIRYGNINFSNNADGTEFFLMNLKGYLLTIVTLGIYSFWWQKDIFNYYIDNMQLKQDTNKIKMRSTATGLDFLKLGLTNALLIVFTFGIATAWVEMRRLRFIFSHIQMKGNIDLNSVTQTEEEYKDALGEDAMDFLNLDII
ncbi:MAG: hypothetical protein RLZZ65_1195 [Bacteroidota bacterium]|jgi:uncharacterized membrane protein YjgN (DUF898 family)